MNIVLNGRNFELLPDKALYDPLLKLLIIADVHLGKAAHFRKEGIAIPSAAQEGDYIALQALFQKVSPSKVYFLGDLFHSRFNNDWHSFCSLIRNFPDIQFVLIKGNHDIIDIKRFKDLCIEVVDQIAERNLVFSHEPLKSLPESIINICGHIHPGIVLRGQGRQSLKLPCFYLNGQTFILPAFGVLTGLYPMQQGKNVQAFAVLPDSVKRVL